MQVNVVVVEIGVDAERVELTGLRCHAIGLLVIAPVADVANAFCGEQVRGVQGLLEIGAGPADGAYARRPLDRRDRGADIIALLVFGDRKSTRLNSSHSSISYAVFCLKKKKK